MPLRERERERERERKNFFFCPTYGPKRKFRKSGKSLVGKRSKVPFLIRNGGEKLKQVVFPMFMCDLHRLSHIVAYNSDSTLRYRVLVVFFYIKCKKKCKYPPVTRFAIGFRSCDWCTWIGNDR